MRESAAVHGGRVRVGLLPVALLLVQASLTVGFLQADRSTRIGLVIVNLLITILLLGWALRFLWSASRASLLLAVSPGTLVRSEPWVQPDSTVFLSARRLMHEGRFAEASQAFRAATQLHPGDPQAWLGSAAALTLLGRYDETLQALDRALALDPRLARAWQNKGLVLHRMGRLAEAMQAVEHALAIDPESPVALYNLACIAAATGDKERALSVLDHLRAHPHFLRAAATDPDLATLRGEEAFAILQKRGADLQGAS